MTTRTRLLPNRDDREIDRLLALALGVLVLVMFASIALANILDAWWPVFIAVVVDLVVLAALVAVMARRNGRSFLTEFEVEARAVFRRPPRDSEPH